MSTVPLKNIIIAGATGSVGAPILAGLLAEPSFKVTILTRASSSSTYPSDLPIIKVSDAFTVTELTSAFKGQDAVVVATSTGAITQDSLPFRFIDAALAAGVKRFVPSEFGADNLDPRAQNLTPTYAAKGAMLEYLMKKCEESQGKMTWTTFVCGSWADWALSPPLSGSFYSFELALRRATIWDSGLARFSITTSTNTGLAVSRSLSPAHFLATANRQIFTSDFVSTQRDVLAEIEKQLGAKFEVEKKSSEDGIKQLKKRIEGGDDGAVYELLALSFVADVNCGYDFETEGKDLWNEKLDLPGSELEKIVRGALVANRLI